VSRPRVYLHTLGCPKNDADSRRLSRVLVGRCVELAASPDEATHLLINTCGFTQDAKEESIAAILSAAGDYPDRTLLVMGCLVQRYRKDLQEGLPEVTAWYGLGDMERLVADLSREEPVPTGEVCPVSSQERAPSAYVKISDGCGHGCTFCAIPAIKGPYRALPLEDILDQAQAALDEGARELVLVGQDTAIWHDGRSELLDLVQRLSEDERVAWVRLMYLQPEHVSRRLLEGMAHHPKLCRYLDLPFQHAARRVLERMGREGDAVRHLELIAQARNLMPDVSLRSTFIVGFPGEKEEDMAALLTFVATAGFDHAGAFIYSPEDGTVAAGLRPHVPRRTALERLNRLNEVLYESGAAAASARVGDSVEVLVESLEPQDEWPEGSWGEGRTRSQAPEVDGRTFLTGTPPALRRVGDMVLGDIIDAFGYDLVVRAHVAP
jgi:ribosomal protein S12 methylthiotransferase